MKRLLLCLALAATSARADVPSYAVVSTVAGADGGWDLGSVDPVHQRLYVARSDAIMAVDLASGTVTDRVAPAQRGHAALWIPGTSDVLETNGSANNAVIFDGLTGRRRATIATGTKPDAAAYDPVTRTVWIMNPGDGTITVVDPVTASVVGTVTVGGSLELAAADGRGKLFVNVEDSNEVAVIDTARRIVIRRETLPGCDGPTGIAYVGAPAETVSACGNGVADILSAAGKFVATVAIGRGPDGAAYDPASRSVLIPSGAEGNLYVIAVGGRPRVVARVPTARSARTIAFDPQSGRAYLPAADLLPAVGSERPKPKPGTFRILVVSRVNHGLVRH